MVNPSPEHDTRYVNAGLPAAQARKQRNHQHLEKVVACRVAGPGILDPFEKFEEFFHALPLRSARAAVAASLNIMKQWSLKCVCPADPDPPDVVLLAENPVMGKCN